jgi:hypothetical protein
MPQDVGKLLHPARDAAEDLQVAEGACKGATSVRGAEAARGPLVPEVPNTRMPRPLPPPAAAVRRPDHWQAAGGGKILRLALTRQAGYHPHLQYTRSALPPPGTSTSAASVSLRPLRGSLLASACSGASQSTGWCLCSRTCKGRPASGRQAGGGRCQPPSSCAAEPPTAGAAGGAAGAAAHLDQPKVELAQQRVAVHAAALRRRSPGARRQRRPEAQAPSCAPAGAARPLPGSRGGSLWRQEPATGEACSACGLEASAGPSGQSLVARRQPAQPGPSPAPLARAEASAARGTRRGRRS